MGLPIYPTGLFTGIWQRENHRNEKVIFRLWSLPSTSPVETSASVITLTTVPFLWLRSYDRPNASEVTLKDMGIIGWFQNTAKHPQCVHIFTLDIAPHSVDSDLSVIKLLPKRREYRRSFDSCFGIGVYWSWKSETKPYICSEYVIRRKLNVFEKFMDTYHFLINWHIDQCVSYCQMRKVSIMYCSDGCNKCLPVIPTVKTLI